MSILKYLLKSATLLAILYCILNAPEILRGGHELADIPRRLWRLAIGSAVALALFVGASTGESKAHH